MATFPAMTMMWTNSWTMILGQDNRSSNGDNGSKTHSSDATWPVKKTLEISACRTSRSKQRNRGKVNNNNKCSRNNKFIKFKGVVRRINLGKVNSINSRDNIPI